VNIGIVTTWCERGASYVSKQYKEVLRIENNVFIFVRAGEYPIDDPNWNTGEVLWSKKMPIHFETTFDLIEFKEWIQKNKIETVFFNEQRWWEPVLLCKKLGIKTGAYIDYYTELTIPYFEIYDFLICNTKRHFETFNWHSQCYFIPWGTITDIYKPGNYSSVSEGCVTFFLSTGMDAMRKGSDLLLDAFDLIKHTDARLVIHSILPLEKFLPEKKELIENLVSINKLSCIYKTVGTPGLYHLGDVYVYPSRLEGIGLTIAEALSCALPVIVPDFPPMNEFASDQSGKKVKIDKLFSRYDGYYWPQCECNIEDLSAKMLFYVENKDKIEIYKRAAREYAVTNLDWVKNSGNLNHILENSKFNSEVLSKKIFETCRSFEKSRYKLSLHELLLSNPAVYKLHFKKPTIINRILRKIYSKVL
jgi:glycosyltransferase involved in cell wall biosynthesis